MANTENIEAKLCAYVDGDIDDAGRAEIEAHLASNPQHRQLLDELRGQRALLSGLPRARAPEDLSDAFQSQLERSVLLDGAEGHPEVAGRITRAPQIFAAAAVLILGIGLIAVIYMVLPARNQSPRVAIHNTPPAAPVGATTAPAARVPELATGGAAAGGESTASRRAGTQPAPDTALAMRNPEDKDVSRKFAANRSRAGDNLGVAAGPSTSAVTGAAGAIAVAPQPPPVLPSAPPPPAATNSDVFASKSGGPAAVTENQTTSAISNIFANAPPLDAQAAEKLKQAPGVPDNAAVVVVASDNPTATKQRVQEYLEKNGIRWESVTEPMPPPIEFGPSQAVAPSRLQNNVDMRLKGGAAPVQQKSSSQQEAPQKDVNQQQQKVAENSAAGERQEKQLARPRWSPGDRPIRQGESGPAGTGAGIASADRIAAGKAETPAAAAAPAPAPAAATGSASPTTSPAYDVPAQQPSAVAGAQAAQQRADVDGQPSEQQAARQPQQPAQQQLAAADSAGSQRLIIARGLTAKQVAELNLHIASNNAGRVIDYRRSGGGAIDETKRGSGSGGQPGEFGGAASSGYGGGGYGFNEAANKAPAPATQPAPVATPSTVASSEADALRKLQSATPAAQPGASATAPSTVSTTAPSATPPIAGLEHPQVATTSGSDTRKGSPAATQPFASSATPTTQPAAATTESLARMDVVICVQPAGQNAQQPAVQVQPPAPANAAPATAPSAIPNPAPTTQPATAPAQY